MKTYKEYSYDELTGSIQTVLAWLQKETGDAEEAGWTNLSLDADAEIDEDTYWGESTYSARCTFYLRGTPPK